ncbi:hypothetical protein C7293_13425 [filamentous cyanobacterium CCT1]|nr:hypothetical protein C7293_13425 [filamentous cyanobacterium CCT1]PSN80324.1 hypothetical protein C8B47_07195 [filamentous cyanobacterium CCP4]
MAVMRSSCKFSSDTQGHYLLQPWWRWTSGLVVALWCLVAMPSPALAQLSPVAPVTEIITTLEAAVATSYPGAPYANPCDATDINTPGGSGFLNCTGLGTVNLTFGGGQEVILQAVIAAGSRFEPARELLPPAGLPERILFRRNGPNLGVAGAQRDQLFYASVSANPSDIVLAPGEQNNPDLALLSRSINRGIDNVFNNASVSSNNQDTRNNIERIDYLIGNPGVTLIDAEVGDVGFLIQERGGNDAFAIAAVTAVDPATGDPTAYGPLVQVPASAWGGTGNVGVNFPSVVLRRDDPANAAPQFRPSHPVPEQNVRGLFFPINSLLPAPQSTQPFFGYSLFAADVAPGANLVNFATFPTNTPGLGANAPGGLDLVAGGFGLVRRVTPPPAPAGNLALLKRITNLFGPAPLPNFNQVIGDGTALTLLQNNGLGQGIDVINDPPVQTSDGIEYTVYFANSGVGDANNVLLCDQIPIGTTFNPNSFGTGQGIQAIASSAPAGPVVNYTNANDGDPGQFIAPGVALPPFCGVNQGNGAVVVNAGTVGSNQVGLIRFRTTVN